MREAEAGPTRTPDGAEIIATTSSFVIGGQSGAMGNPGHWVM